jgi:NitT/TauT family transport system substrate-binding protein
MKNFKRVIALLLALTCALVCLTSCKSEAPAKPITQEQAAAPIDTDALAKETAPKVYAITGPTGVGIVHMMEDYEITLTSAPTDVVGKISTGAADIAAVPTNVASTLYNKTNGGVSVLCVNTLGVLYIMDKDGSVKSFADLEGKTIWTMGEGANPQYTLEYLLKKNNVNATVKFAADNDELVAKMASGEAEIAMVPQPVATSAAGKTGFKIALDVTAEWDKVSEDSRLMMGCVIVRNEYLAANPNQVKAFLKDYEASIKKVNENVPEAAALCEQYKIIPKAALAEKAIPKCNIVYMSGAEMKAGLEGYLQVLFDANPKSIGGKMPEAGFYYGA